MQLRKQIMKTNCFFTNLIQDLIHKLFTAFTIAVSYISLFTAFTTAVFIRTISFLGNLHHRRNLETLIYKIVHCLMYTITINTSTVLKDDTDACEITAIERKLWKVTLLLIIAASEKNRNQKRRIMKLLKLR